MHLCTILTYALSQFLILFLSSLPSYPQTQQRAEVSVVTDTKLQMVYAVVYPELYFDIFPVFYFFPLPLDISSLLLPLTKARHQSATKLFQPAI